MEKSITQLAREHMIARHGFAGKKRFGSSKSECAICGRQMESPKWEEGPKYCWKCSDRHEIGREDI